MNSPGGETPQLDRRTRGTMPVNIGARLAVEVDGEVSTALTSGPSCMRGLHGA